MGQVRRAQQTILGQFMTSTPCPACGGEGVSITDPCPDCRGRGRVARTRTLTVKVPPGIDENASLRLTGQGEASPDGGLPGNVYVRVTVEPHPLFTRRDRTIQSQLRVNVAQAALGDELEVETIDGPVAFRLPEGTQSGQQFRLRGRGAPAIGGGDRGDQIVTVQVVTPRKLTAEQRELFAQLATTLDADNSRVEGERNFFARVKDALRF
jgi:molecular chaperone DnaJ